MSNDGGDEFDLSKVGRIKLAALRKEIFEAQVKENMSSNGGDKKSKKSPVTKTPNPMENTGRVQERLAKEAGVGQGTQQRYDQIMKYGSPELIEMVESETLSIGNAYKMTGKGYPQELKKVDRCIAHAAECLPFPGAKGIVMQ